LITSFPQNISDEKLEQLFAALPQNEHLEVLSLTNVGLTDKTALLLAEAIEKRNKFPFCFVDFSHHKDNHAHHPGQTLWQGSE